MRRTFAAAWAVTFLINIAWGVTFPLLNIYIHDQGVSLVSIGTLGTVGSITFSVAGLLLGRLSDAVGKRRDLVTALLLAGAAGSLAYLGARQYAHFLALALLNMAVLGGYVVLLDALVTSVLPEDRRGGDFGWYRVSGSIGFALAGSLLGMVIGAAGIRIIFVIAALALLAAAVASRFMQDRQTEASPTGAAAGASRGGTLRILIATGLLWLMVADLVAIFGSSLAYPFLTIYLDERLGATAGQIGLLFTVGVLAEIPAMIWLGRLSDRTGRGAILALGFFSMTVSWLLIYLAPDLLLIYPARVLAGMSIIRYSVGVALVSDRVPYEQRGTLLGLTNLTVGAGGLVAPTVGGLIAESTGIRPVFLIAFAISAAASVLYVLTMRRWQPALPHGRSYDPPS